MSEELETLPPTNDRRIPKASEARSMFTKLRTNSATRRKVQAALLKQIGGERPMSPEKLRNMGRGDECNVNWGDARAFLDKADLKTWQLLNDGFNLTNVEILDNINEATLYQQYLQEVFDEFYKDWGMDWVTQFFMMARDHNTFGVGACMFSDPESPRFKAMQYSAAEVPERTPSNVSRMPIIFVEDEMMASELWDRLRDEKTRDINRSAGWNLGTMRKALIAAVTGDRSSFDASDWVRAEEKLRANSFAADEESGIIPIVYVFCKEYDGTVSTSLFVNGPAGEDSTEYLYTNFSKPGLPTRMDKVINMIFAEVGMGRYHTIKGFGIKNRDILRTLNLTKCRLVNNATADGLNLIDRNGEVRKKGIVQFGSVTFFPEGVERIQATPSYDGTVLALRMIDNQFHANNASANRQAEMIQGSRTAAEVQAISSLSQSMDVANATLFLSQFSEVLSNQFDRLRANTRDPDAVNFRNRCEEKGLPYEALRKIRVRVSTGANPGQASNAVRAQITSQLLPMMGSPHINEEATLRTYVTALGGGSLARDILNQRAVSAERDANLRMAQIENGVLGTGVELPAPKSELHEIHIAKHLEVIIPHLEQAKQGNTLTEQMSMVISIALNHVNQHLDHLSTDAFKKDTFAQANAQVKAVVGAFHNAELNRQKVERSQRQLQETGRQSGGMPAEGHMPQEQAPRPEQHT